MKISELYNIFLKHPVITTDSRDVPDNSIFWALKGENFNGNNYVADALNSGASYAITDDKASFISEKTIFFDDTLKTLQLLANYHRKQLNLPIFALTGTNGKTTTKELIFKILSSQYNAVATKGNLNNHIGVPLTILRIKKETEIAIIEMGANHPSEIQQLCDIAKPNFGLITNIGKAHLEGFGSFEGIIKTKSELYQNIIKNNGTIFYNSDNSILNSLEKGLKTLSYGTNSDNYLNSSLLSVNPFVNLEIETFEGLKTEINSQLIGAYNFENITAAACVGDFFKISIQNIKKAIENYTPDNNRSQFIKKDTNEIISDAYNANPTSMKASLNNFFTLKKRNKIIILGDMYELGKYSKKEHTEILELLKIALRENDSVNEIIVTGKYFNEAFNNDFQDSGIIHFITTNELETFLKNKTYNNCTFLIKGSRALKLENLITFID